LIETLTPSPKVAILTASDRAAAGAYADASGPALQELVVRALGAEVRARRILPDDREQLAAQLRAWADAGVEGSPLDLILVTGGTGFAPKDVTPEATRDVLDKEAPGLAGHDSSCPFGGCHASRVHNSASQYVPGKPQGHYG